MVGKQGWVLNPFLPSLASEHRKKENKKERKRGVGVGKSETKINLHG